MTFKELLKKMFPEKTAEIDQLDENPQPQTTPPAKSDNTDLKLFLEAFKTENKKLLDELAAIKVKDEERLKLLEQKSKEEREKEIEAIIKKAIESKAIPGENKDLLGKYKTLLEKDFEGAKIVIENLQKFGEKIVPPGEKSNAGGEVNKNKVTGPLDTKNTLLTKIQEYQNNN